ncbi:MAG: deoxynucleoside kinase, partial [Alcanivoracaceae bacterium]|nr:deoxynucleoside kinase [Alcanivoracaceae bacterium]
MNSKLEALKQRGQLPRFIAVEGAIGVGKTTLARRLAETFNYQTLLEQAEENPFLTRFYQEPKRYALQTQLFFLFQRAQQLRDLKQADLFESVHVSDFLID